MIHLLDVTVLIFGRCNGFIRVYPKTDTVNLTINESKTRASYLPPQRISRRCLAIMAIWDPTAGITVINEPTKTTKTVLKLAAFQEENIPLALSYLDMVPTRI